MFNEAEIIYLFTVTTIMWILWILHSYLLLATLTWSSSLSCQVNKEDPIVIENILHRILSSDFNSMGKLAGAFFEDQPRPPNSVQVAYLIQVPYKSVDSQCISECSCWKDACNNTDCEPGYCCFERDFLWGRRPMYIRDSIFRQLSMCGFVIGGINEIIISIPLNMSDESADILCSMCHDGADKMSVTVAKASLGTDTVIQFGQPSSSPLDRALQSLTEKVS